MKTIKIMVDDKEFDTIEEAEDYVSKSSQGKASLDYDATTTQTLKEFIPDLQDELSKLEGGSLSEFPREVEVFVQYAIDKAGQDIKINFAHLYNYIYKEYIDARFLSYVSTRSLFVKMTNIEALKIKDKLAEDFVGSKESAEYEIDYLMRIISILSE